MATAHTEPLALRQANAISWLMFTDKEELLAILLNGHVPHDAMADFLCDQIRKHIKHRPIQINQDPRELSSRECAALVLGHSDTVELFDFLTRCGPFTNLQHTPYYSDT